MDFIWKIWGKSDGQVTMTESLDMLVLGMSSVYRRRRYYTGCFRRNSKYFRRW